MITEIRALLLDIHDFERLHIATHPDKIRILRLLLRKNSVGIDTMQKKLPLTRRVLVAQLSELENLGLIECDSVPNQSEIKHYRATEKGKFIYENMVHLLDVLKVPRKKAKKTMFRKT